MKTCIGQLTVTVRDGKTGAIIRHQTNSNIITDVGLEHMAKLLGGDLDWMDTMAVGTGVVLPSNTDTSLDTQVFSNDIARRVPTTANLRMQMFLGTGDANGFTLSEAGIFNKALEMFSRVLITPTFAKNAGNTLTLTWDFTFMEGTP